MNARQAMTPAPLIVISHLLVGILTHSDLLRALVLDKPEAVA